MIRHGFLFSHDEAAQQRYPSSGDGACQVSRVDPRTGSPDPAYTPAQETPRASTAGTSGDGSAHGDVASFHRAQQQAMQITDGAAGFGLRGDVDAGFDVTGAVPMDSNYQATTSAGDPDRLITKDVGLPDDSNLQVGGRPVGLA